MRSWSRGARLGVALGALGLVVGAAALLVPCPGPGEDAPDTIGAAPLTASTTVDEAPRPFAGPARLRGAVMIELDPPPTEPAAAGEAPSDPELVPASECLVLAWRDGARLGDPARCDAEGRYELALDAPPASAAIEILVSGYLRAVLLVEPVPGETVGVPTVALGPASLLEGVVIDSQGRPIAGAAISARPRPDLGEPEPWRAESASDGRFRLDTIPAGPIVLEAVYPGHALTVVDAVAPEPRVTIVLDALRDLQGEVLGPPDAQARARVWIEGSSIWPPLAVAVGEGGRFTIPGIPDGVYGLIAEVPGDEGEREYASLPLENVTPAMTVSLALIEAARVPVRVQDPEGRPVRGAHVTLGADRVGLLQRIAETGPSGQVLAGPVVPGPYLVHADADGYLPSETVAVDLQVGAPLPEVTLTLIRPARIVGAVVDEIGEAVVDARVTVESEVLYSPGEALVRARTLSALLAGGALGVTAGMVPPIPLFDDEAIHEWTEGATQSDRDGRFLLDLLLPGTYRLRALHQGHAASALVSVTVGPGELRGDVILVLQTGRSLTGRVRDRNGQPLAGVRVELDDGQVLVTDERGAFDAGLHRGKRTLILRAPGMIPQAVEIEVGARDVDLDRVLLPAEGAFEGRVRDGNGQPIAGARVALYPGDGLSSTQVTYSDARGLFTLEGLSPGAADLEVDHPDFAPLGERLKVAGRPERGVRELALDRGWELQVVVRERGSGDPISGASIVLDGRSATTDAAGEATLSRLAAARVIATVDAPGWVRGRLSVDRPEGGRAAVTIDLEEGAGLEGSIQDERGEPVPGARIVVRHRRSGEILAETESGPRGAWRVDRLGEGDVIVEATPPADLAAILAPVSAPTDVLRGHVTRGVDLRFDRL